MEAWHKYIRDEINVGNLSVKVFTVNNHYLGHLGHMTRQLGPLKHYSCRSTERTIKEFANKIKSTTKPGVNSSNVLLNIVNLQQYGITTSLANNDQVNADQSSPVSFVSHPSGNDQFPQLWDPADEAYLLSNGVITPDLRDQDLVVALRSYYR